jgi:hypothetical protein
MPVQGVKSFCVNIDRALTSQSRGIITFGDTPGLAAIAHLIFLPFSARDKNGHYRNQIRSKY